jgi:CheY-like chemotaxis protein
MAAPSILVVDDDMGDIQLVHRALSALAYDATLYAVQSVELAARFLEGHDAFAGMPRPDLVVLDLHLPEASGYDVLRLMRADARWRAIPISVLTLDAEPTARERCLALGADDFHLKPADGEGYRAWAESLVRLLGRPRATVVDRT